MPLGKRPLHGGEFLGGTLGADDVLAVVDESLARERLLADGTLEAPGVPVQALVRYELCATGACK